MKQKNTGITTARAVGSLRQMPRLSPWCNGMDSIGLVICLLITENHTTRRKATRVRSRGRRNDIHKRGGELTLALIAAGRLPRALAGATPLALALSEGAGEERLVMR